MAHPLRRLPIVVLLATALPGVSEAASLAEVFNGQRLGAPQQALESLAGAPVQSSGNRHQYRVQGCDVTATVDSGKVTALRLALTPACQADVPGLLGTSSAPLAEQPLTVGSLHKITGDMAFYADCLTLCGNAADPVLYGHWENTGDTALREIMLEVVLAGDAATAAAQKWQDEMTAARGGDWVMDTRFNCERDFDDAAQRDFAAVPIDAISIGSGLAKPGC